ncbi:MAG: mechanosensitive ion channel domain-containing protein [Pseudomonadota bacterium]
MARLITNPILTLLLVSGLWLLAGTAAAQGLSLTGGGEDTAGPPPLPAPNNLQQGWWADVTGEGVDVGERIAELKIAIDASVETVAEEDVGDIPQAAERAKERLDAYLEELGRAVEEREITVRTDGAFSLTDLFNAASAVRDREITLTDLNENLGGSKQLLEQSRSRYDSDILNHRDQNEGSIAAIQTGVEAIASRAELAVLTLRDQRAEARRAQLERQIQQYRQQLVVAQAQVSVEGFDPEAAKEALAQTQAELVESEETLGTRQRELLKVDETTEAGVVRAQLVRQQLLSALADTTRLQLIQARQQGELLWHEARSEEGAAATDMQAYLESLRELIAQSEGEFSGWQRLTASFLLEPPSSAITNRTRELRAADQQARELAVKNLRQVRELGSLVEHNRLLEGLLARELAGSDSGLSGLWLSTKLALAAAFSNADQWADFTLFHLGDDPVTLWELAKVLLILVATFVLSWLVRSALQRMKDRRHITETHSLYAASRILHYLIITLGLLFGLSTLGLDFTSIALIAGALSVGIGFGLQTTVNNFVSGLILLFDRSLKVGDYVELDSGLRGTVREISVRATRINTNDNVDVVVPNSEFVSTRLVNWTMVEGFARLRVNFGVAYGTDKEVVKQVALAATERVDYTLTHLRGHEPQIRLVNFGDNALEFQLLVWVNRSGVQRPGRARAAYMWELEAGLTEAGIEIPFPQRDLHIRSDQTRAGEIEPAEPRSVVPFKPSDARPGTESST